ncbi:hypothetical protein [Burkholderia sp. Bp8963]|uniref:hypothetical protein n=1 Tax=Burkholderia sp. Bp8963 TaxID=2184547 RepID=UPI00163A1A4B|nr:hypothetical protein [Burkholderia sp. Bp8963]
MDAFIVFPACRLLLPVKTTGYFRDRRQWRALYVSAIKHVRVAAVSGKFFRQAVDAP